MSLLAQGVYTTMVPQSSSSRFDECSTIGLITVQIMVFSSCSIMQASINGFSFTLSHLYAKLLLICNRFCFIFSSSFLLRLSLINLSLISSSQCHNDIQHIIMNIMKAHWGQIVNLSPRDTQKDHTSQLEEDQLVQQQHLVKSPFQKITDCIQRFRVLSEASKRSVNSVCSE